MTVLGETMFFTLTIFSVYAFGLKITQAQPFPCCTNTSTSTCCISMNCDAFSQNLRCSNISGIFFTFQRADSDGEFCIYENDSTQGTITSNSSSIPDKNDTICYTTCPENTYDFESQCLRCDDACLNCTGSGTNIQNCTCAYGDNGTNCCPKGTIGRKLGNSYSSACVPSKESSQEPGTPGWVIPVAAGVGGGVVLIVIIIAVYCCCCSRKNVDQSEERSRKRRPVSQLLQERLGLSKRKRTSTSQADLVTFSTNPGQSSIQEQSLYENVETPDQRAIAAHALLQHDKTFRYIKDPTLPRIQKKDEFKDRPVTGMYQNDSAIRLQRNRERHEIETLGEAPPVPKTTSSKKKSLKLPKFPGSSSKKHKNNKTDPKTKSDDDSELEDYVDMSGANAVSAPGESPHKKNSGVENKGFSSESPYANVEYKKYNTAPAHFDAQTVEEEQHEHVMEGPSEEYENFQIPYETSEPIYENKKIGTI